MESKPKREPKNKGIKKYALNDINGASWLGDLKGWKPKTSDDP